MADINVLRKLRIRFGSLVDAPANPNATIELFKFDRTANRKEADMPENIKKDEPETVDLAAQLEAANATIATLQTEIAGLKAVPANPDELNKADLPEAVRKRLEDLEKRATAAEVLAKAERDARVEREWIEKAQPIKFVEAPKFGPILKRIAEKETTDADVTELMRVLAAASEQIDKGDLFTKVSKDESPSATDAMAQILAKAAALREATPGLTKEQAVAKVLDTNPELYDQYNAGK